MVNYVGIDISKRDFHAAFTEQGETVRFANDRKGINGFIRFLGDNGFMPGETAIGMESTGYYHLLPALMLSHGGYRVNIINPLITRRQTQTTLRQVKNDKKDAKLIRYCTAKGEGYIFAETEETLLLKTLVRQRNDLSCLRIKMKLRQQSVDHREDCINRPITSVNRDLHDVLTVKIRGLDKELSQYWKALQRLLRSVPGVGPLTAVSFVSEIGDIKRFPSPKELTAFIGLDPRTHKSGTSINGRGYITKRGNKILRTRLFNAASAAIQRPNLFRDFFLKKRTEGKPYRVALCAVMHKMIHVIYAVWARGTPFIK